MKHAFLIMAHHNEGQLVELLSLLDDARNGIFLHIDSKWEDVSLARLRSAVGKAELVVVERMRVTWGGDSQIRCELRLLEAAVKGHYDYYHLLSGDDLPIKKMDTIDAFFEQNAGTEFVGVKEMGFLDDLSGQISLRLRVYYPFQNLLGRRFFRLTLLAAKVQSLIGIDRAKNEELTIYGKGCNWFSITHEFATYVTERADVIRAQYKETLCCDEVFLQTELISSPFADRRATGGEGEACLRFIDWTRGGAVCFSLGGLFRDSRLPVPIRQKVQRRS